MVTDERIDLFRRAKATTASLDEDLFWCQF